MVYYPKKDYDVPDIDLLTFLFKSPLTWLKDDEIAHAEAAQPNNHLTKAEIRTIVKRLIHVFRNQFGIGANGSGKDVVICMVSGQIVLSSIFLAIVGAGGVYSATSTAFTPAELARQIKQGPSNLVIVSADVKEVALKAARECGVPLDRVLVVQSDAGKRELYDTTGKGKNYLDEKAEMDWERVTDQKVLVERAICLLYSSGTTGPPKGVHVSNRNMVAEALIPQLIYREHIEAQKTRDPSWSFQYRTIGHLPVAHIAGCQGYLVNPMVAGGVIYWMPKFDFPKFLEYSKKFQTSSFFTVPPIYLLIAKSPLVTDQFAHVQLAISGAAPMGAELQSMAESKLGCKRIAQTWGLSESTGSVTVMPWDEHDPTGSVSPVMANCRLRITDDDGNDVKEGDEGEFLIKGPVVTVGYWKNQKATDDSFTSDGWFKTGDVGVCREGRFYVVDRKKEMIKYNALQVAPAELEAHLISHPQIQDAAVIGVPDPSGSGNELPRAYVVVAAEDKQGAASEEKIKAFVKDNLANHKQLRGGVVYLDVIPKAPSGKILRRVLRDMARQEGRPKL